MISEDLTGAELQIRRRSRKIGCSCTIGEVPLLTVRYQVASR